MDILRSAGLAWLQLLRELALTDVGQTLHQNEILLTGGSGFLGKVLLALLLDRYPEVKHLHVLIRPHGNHSAEERFFSETLASPVLTSIVKNLGKDFLRKKITVWAGDVSQPGCGLSSKEQERLSGRVDLLINCAGLVEFFPPVDESFASNVDGVEHVIALSKRLGAKLAHVSTCYVCGEADGLIEETEPIPGFYPRRKGPHDRKFNHLEEMRYCRERIRQICDSSSSRSERGRPKDVVQRLIALGKQRAEYWGWVNTYTYAKSLGEQLIAAEPGLHYAIIRPGIIESTLHFPFPGWIEGGRTAAPLVLMALGGLRHWPVRKDAPLEVIPVDLVASAMVVISALLLHGRHKDVYQLGTADVNPVLLKELLGLLGAESRKRHRKNGNTVQVGLINWLLGSSKRKPVRFLTHEASRARSARLQKRIRRTENLLASVQKLVKTTGLPGRRSLSAYTSALRTLSLQATFREQTLQQYLPFILHNRYIFESENIRRAYSLISEKDRKLLPWEPERIDWEQYWIHNQIQGIERWVQPEAVREWTFKI